MIERLFSSMMNGISPTWQIFLICLGVSFFLGFMLALAYSLRAECTKSFFATICVLPSVVCLVIFIVNGNVGAGVAVAGAFSLVRFRSVPGRGREICAIFVCMAVGLALGMGFVGYAVVFALLSELFTTLISHVKVFGVRESGARRELRVTVPESLNFTGLFDDVLCKYTTSHRLVKVKTVNMGAMYRLQYVVTLRNGVNEKEMMDEIRTHNGNLEVCCSDVASDFEEL